MRKLLLSLPLALAMCAPAPAGEVTILKYHAMSPNEAWMESDDMSVSWGRYSTKAEVYIRPSEDHVAEVVFMNRMSHYPPLEFTAELEIDGIVVLVHLVMGEGYDPDYIAVIPPAGYASIPVDAYVDEDTAGIFIIVEEVHG